MIIADQHMHSVNSPDGRCTIAEMAESAVKKGLKHICLTEHMDMDFPRGIELWPELDARRYREEFLQVQEQFEGRLSMAWGVEYGMQPHLLDRAKEFLNGYPFDFVIGSGHVTNGQLPTALEFYRDRPLQDALWEYFEDLARNLKLFDDYDVCGHIDYVVRYCPGQDRDYHYADYAGIMEPLLRTLVEKGKGLEVNSGGLRYGLREPNPCGAILRKYKELGGEIVTIGSDAHRAGDIALKFDAARELLLDCGFTRYCVFRERKPEFLPL